jgi:PAB-dependent poly(A)-specific ribonuclease subunit 3
LIDVGILALVVAYTYHAGAQNLLDAHFKTPALGSLNPFPTQVGERTMWSYVVQIASALKCVHEAGLAVRTIEASKILVTMKNRYAQPITFCPSLMSI